MQHQRTVRGPSGLRFSIDTPPINGVRGFGVCDVLKVELDASQVRWLIDEIEERQRVAAEAWREATARWDVVPEQAREAGHPVDQEVADAAYQIDHLAALRAQVSAAVGDGAAALVGPQCLIGEVIWAAARNTAEDLVDLVRNGGRAGVGEREALLEAARAVLAFAAWHVACLELTWFSFEPEASPRCG